MRFARRPILLIALTLVIAAALLVAWVRTVARLHPTPANARVEIADIERFMATMDSLAGAESTVDSVRIVKENYLDPGSAGLHAFVRSRIGSADALVAQMRSHRRYYAHLSRSLAGIADTKEDILAAFARFETLYPPARFSDVYLVIGRMSSGGTTSPGKILIGAEMYGVDAEAPKEELTEWERAVLGNRDLLSTIAMHELMHLLQRYRWRANLLEQAIREGGADFVAELVTGKHVNTHVHAWARPREARIWEEFRREMLGRDFARWFGAGAKDRPADVGYWIGYRIAQTYYESAADKAQAIDDILRMRDAKRLLALSGYTGSRQAH